MKDKGFFTEEDVTAAQSMFRVAFTPLAICLLVSTGAFFTEALGIDTPLTLGRFLCGIAGSTCWALGYIFFRIFVR